jgi:peptidoglycan LD-endopeptidase CwlK
MPAFGAASKRQLASCHPDLQRLFNVVIELIDCKVVEGYRSKVNQDKAYAEGKSKLRWPQSRHNTYPSLAVDVVPYPVDWNERKRFVSLAGTVLRIANELGIKIRWGGDWDQDGDWKDERFSDMPHYELVE